MTITEFMSKDHDRLDALFASFAKTKDAGEAKSLFARFAAGLKTHIVWEEDLLFPPFEEKTGMRAMGPTEVMRAEHREIKEILSRIDENLQRSRDTAELHAALLDVLGGHNDKEEGILYPALDRLLSRAEAEKVLAEIERTPALA